MKNPVNKSFVKKDTYRDAFLIKRFLMPNNIDAITVSVNYADILSIIMPQNQQFFTNWYILTSEKDEITHRVIEKYDYSNVKSLNFNFYEKHIFNKGGAIRSAQKTITESVYDDKKILILDSDILLPDNFEDVIANIDFECNTLYSAERKIYHSMKNLLEDKPDKVDNTDFFGFFQLYKYKENKDKLYENSMDCSVCDLKFKNLFKKRKKIDNFYVAHLGKTNCNWKGRRKQGFYF